MIKKSEFPILEFDDSKTAVINPSIYRNMELKHHKLVITFFPEVMKELISEGTIEEYFTIGGEVPVVLYKFKDSDVLITHGQIGCPACGGNLDMFYGMGIDKVTFCGGGGVLDKNIKVGEVVLVDKAIRDEGFSYHYLEPSRFVDANKEVNDKVAKYLDEQNIPYMRGCVWTCDAIFRETPDKVALRRSEGAKIVEMEQAGCLAVAKVRGIDYAALIYGGDDVSSSEWDSRRWSDRKGYRYNLVMLCKELVNII